MNRFRILFLLAIALTIGGGAAIAAPHITQPAADAGIEVAAVTGEIEDASAHWYIKSVWCNSTRYYYTGAIVVTEVNHVYVNNWWDYHETVTYYGSYDQWRRHCAYGGG